MKYLGCINCTKSQGGLLMELKQLEYFVMAADLGSLSKAAEILYTTQPNVSRVVNSLENELNIKLLDRNSKGVVISKEGGEVIWLCKGNIKEFRNDESDSK